MNATQFEIMTEGWDIQRIFEYLTQWMEPADAIQELNLKAFSLPLYHVREGDHETPLKRANPFWRWRLNKDGGIEIANDRTSRVEQVFKAFQDAVMEMWPKPAGKPKKSRRGKPEQFNWHDVAAELIRRIYVDDLQVNKSNDDSKIAKSLSTWCAQKWRDDIPEERTVREYVARWLSPTRKGVGKLK
jgi:hypothetical protein